MKATWLKEELPNLIVIINENLKIQTNIVDIAKQAVIKEIEDYENRSWWGRLTYDNPKKVWFGTRKYRHWCREQDVAISMGLVKKNVELSLKLEAESITLSDSEISYFIQGHTHD